MLHSIYEIIARAREAAEKNFGAAHFDTLIWHVINAFVRPFAAKWHRRGQEGPLATFNDEFRAEFSALQPVLLQFDELLMGSPRRQSTFGWC